MPPTPYWSHQSILDLKKILNMLTLFSTFLKTTSGSLKVMNVKDVEVIYSIVLKMLLVDSPVNSENKPMD